MIEMLRLERTGIFTKIFVSYISIVLCQDRIILPSPTFNESNFISPTENDTVIPETLLIRLNDVQNLSDLLQLFVDSEDNDSPMLRTSRRNRTMHSRKGFSPIGASPVSEPAKCKTEDHIIELDKPENGATLYWPSCVRVKRCGGCCTSKMFECKPLETSILSVTVYQLYYNLENPSGFENQGTKVFPVEQHNRCACICKESEEDCDLNVHEYRSGECKCVCKDADLAASCTGPWKIWDSRSCLCKCRNIRLCSSGRVFNEATCRCEALRRSLSLSRDNI